MSTLRVLRNHSSLLTHTFYIDGDATDPSPDTATVTITRADGTAIVTDGATTPVGTGGFTYTLDVSETATLDKLTADWTASFSGQAHIERDYVEIVGGYYVTIAEIQGLNSMTSATDASCVAARQWFEDEAENHIGVAFVPRFHREVLDGSGSAYLYLNKRPIRQILAVDIEGTAANPADFQVTSGGLVKHTGGVFTWGFQNVTVAYEHGHDYPPADLRRAAGEAIRYVVLGDRSGIPERAIQMNTDTGIGYTMSLQGLLPSVDRVLERHRSPVVA